MVFCKPLLGPFLLRLMMCTSCGRLTVPLLAQPDNAVKLFSTACTGWPSPTGNSSHALRENGPVGATDQEKDIPSERTGYDVNNNKLGHLTIGRIPIQPTESRAGSQRVPGYPADAPTKRTCLSCHVTLLISTFQIKHMGFGEGHA